MFNLIVQGAGWAEGRDTMWTGRTFEYTDPHVEEQFKPDGEFDVPAIMSLPTVFMSESIRDNDPVARIGTITSMRVRGREIVLEYAYDATMPPLTNEILQQFAGELDIGEFEFTRTHWAIKDVDLYRVLLRNMQPRRQQPTVFRIEDPERIEPTLIAAMMPFAPQFDGVYAKLQDTADGLGLRCRRADDIWINPEIIQDVVSLIDHAQVVVCDCSDRNPNVFYEIGIAHALGRDVILITQNADDIPFDLQHFRYIPYLNNEQGLDELAETLTGRLRQLVE